MAVPFIRIGLGVADKLVDKHFEKFNDDLFTPGRRKRGLKRLATPRKKDQAVKAGTAAGVAGAAGEAGEHERSSDSSGEYSDDAEYSDRGNRDRGGRRRRASARADPYRPARARSVDQYYHPEHDYTHDTQYRSPAAAVRYTPTTFEPYPPQAYAQDPYAQDRRRTYVPPRESRSRQVRPGLQKRSSSAGDVRRERREQERSRNAEKRDKEGKLSLVAAGLLAGGAILMSR